jgi:hypothetical protein
MQERLVQSTGHRYNVETDIWKYHNETPVQLLYTKKR